MKILKVKVKRDKTSSVTHYTYPPEYDAKKINVLAYESSSEEGMTDLNNRNDGHEICIGVVSDSDAPQFLASPDISEIPKQEAEQLGSKYKPQTIKTTDQTAVNIALAKFAREEALSDYDIRVLNPEDDTPGLNKTKSFKEILDIIKL